MAQLPGSAFLKGRDRIVRISETGGARAVPASHGSGDPNAAYTVPTANYSGTKFIKGLTSAEYTPSPTSQEFFLMGDDGYRDSVGVTMAGELSCTAFFIQALNSGAASQAIDDALVMIMKSENDPDRELFVEVLTYLGKESSNHKYNTRAFNACVTGVSESAASDGVIEYSWSFQSRGQIFVGEFDGGTSKLDVYS
jgi:hypothetical protein